MLALPSAAGLFSFVTNASVDELSIEWVKLEASPYKPRANRR